MRAACISINVSAVDFTGAFACNLFEYIETTGIATAEIIAITINTTSILSAWYSFTPIPIAANILPIPEPFF